MAGRRGAAQSGGQSWVSLAAALARCSLASLARQSQVRRCDVGLLWGPATFSGMSPGLRPAVMAFQPKKATA